MGSHFIKSPLNYTGGKYRILKNIFSLVPEKVNNFYDIFGGGFNVGINADANKIIFNDQNLYLKEMLEYFKNTDFIKIKNSIDSIIEKYKLNKENEEGYKQLRAEYNQKQTPVILFVLTCYSFNHQIRFNNNKKFNTPFGKNRSSYNDSIEKNLKAFCEALKIKNIEFNSSDFSAFYDVQFYENDLVYCDPPYLITTGSYNDGNRGFKDWGESEENKLLAFLDFLDKMNVKFILSNVLYHKNLRNEILIEWCKKYNIIYVDKNYKNCNYQLKSKSAETVEVLITNIGGMKNE